MSKKDNFLIDKMFLPESEEEIETRRRKNFELSKLNPENMSYWFPKIESSTTKDNSILQIPITRIIQMDYSTWTWLRSDDYSDNNVKVFNDVLLGKIQDFMDGKKLFMKTGIFSDKFVFDKTIVEDKNREEVGRYFLDIYYNSMVVGADTTSEIVFREYIEDKEELPTIYYGMPLHTEFRVFYDFDEKKSVGVANYWHPDVMEIGLYNKKDQTVYSHEKDRIVKEYRENKEMVVSEVEKYMDGCSGLSGRWSVDVMKNAEDYWIIDMARMERSALVDMMEEVIK
ncbi:hypothetical protein MUB24_22660 [Lederbergia sp. NSJ-179]|uniref:hypothetical protein n=1 Tax=Lederbergia sp. NSJ-179 TaxID=2931402 RepID=UPI001FD0211C|nr:hypothetical protein [Lederbergia sp. NSJ-179]MCJ7843619.1 hypothetical protein [Lederbergia sp. NSJ-179]